MEGNTALLKWKTEWTERKQEKLQSIKRRQEILRYENTTRDKRNEKHIKKKTIKECSFTKVSS